MSFTEYINIYRFNYKLAIKYGDEYSRNYFARMLKNSIEKSNDF